MDIQELLSENVVAQMALLGVVIGSLLTAIPAIILQIFQRRWQLKDEQRNWRRERLLHRLSPIHDWLDTVLQLLRAFYATSREETVSIAILGSAVEELKPKFWKHEHLDAIVLSRAVSTGDSKLLKLVEDVISFRNAYIAALSVEDEENRVDTKKALEAVASKTARRVEFLIEQAKPVG